MKVKFLKNMSSEIIQNQPNYRKVIIDALVPYFEKDPRYYLLVGDMGFGAIDKMREKMPERIINYGIMEPGAVGIAAGMAMSGLIPVFYTIVNFLVFRAIEQIRNDVVLQNLNVKFIGNGVNDFFKFLGESHTCGQDDIALMNLIKVKVYDPYTDKRAFEQVIDDYMQSDKAGYIRV